MNIGRIITFVCLIVSLYSCGPGKQLAPPAWYNNPAPAEEGKLRFDGFYNNVSDPRYQRDKYSATDPVFFASRNRAYVIDGAFVVKDSAMFSCAYYKKIDTAYFGRYIIVGNKISAFVPTTVPTKGGALYYVYNLHFTGTIVNNEFITDWRAIPPFPRRIKKRDIENMLNKGLFEGHDLRFIKSDSIRCLPQ